MSEKPKVQQIPIDPNGQYVLLVRGISPAAFEPIAKRLKEWWRDGDSVLLLHLGLDADFEFVRVDDEQESSQE